MNYFGNFGAECHLLKIKYSESSFTKHRGRQCNLCKKKKKHIDDNEEAGVLVILSCYKLYVLLIWVNIFPTNMK